MSQWRTEEKDANMVGVSAHTCMALCPCPGPSDASGWASIGAKCGVDNFACPVTVEGDLRLRTDFSDKVQCFHFREFPHVYGSPDGECGRETLATYLERCKEMIEQSDPAALDAMHQRFVPVVEEIITERGLYRSELSQTRIHVCRYAKPTIRGASSTYAGYLHNDAWIDSEASSVAMVNVWFVLNEIPPRNHLVFYEASASKVHREWGAKQAHMVHGLYEDVLRKPVVFDERMCWGKFYCFVSGQRTTVERVLLHGAMDIPLLPESVGLLAAPARRSAEMRFTICRVRSDVGPSPDCVGRHIDQPECRANDDAALFRFEDL